MPKILIKEILFFPLEIKLFDGVLFIVKVADERIISFITHFKANEKLVKYSSSYRFKFAQPQIRNPWRCIMKHVHKLPSQQVLLFIIHVVSVTND